MQSRTLKVLVLTSGQIAGGVAGMLLAAALVRLLDMRDYGTYRQTLLVYLFAAPLVSLQLPQALYFFLPGETKRPRAVVVENLLLLAAAGALLSVFLLAGGNRLLAARFGNPALARSLLYLAPYPLFMLPADALAACLMARDRSLRLAVFNVAGRLIVVAGVVGITLLHRTAAAALLATVAGAGILLGPSVWLMVTACPRGPAAPTPAGMLRQVRYVAPLGLSGMLETVARNLDKLIVASLCTVEAFGVYVNGAMEIPFLSALPQSIMAVLTPELARLYREGRTSELLALWKATVVKCMALLLPVMVVLMALAPQIVGLVFSEKYLDSVPIFRVYLLLLPVRALNLAAVFTASGRSRVILARTAVGVALGLALALVLVPRFGPLGASLATVLAMLGWVVPFSVARIGRILGVPVRDTLPVSGLLKAGGAALLPAAVFTLRDRVGLPGDALKLAVFAPVYGALALALLHAGGVVDARALLRRALSAARGAESAER